VEVQAEKRREEGEATAAIAKRKWAEKATANKEDAKMAAAAKIVEEKGKSTVEKKDREERKEVAAENDDLAAADEMLEDETKGALEKKERQEREREERTKEPEGGTWKLQVHDAGKSKAEEGERERTKE